MRTRASLLATILSIGGLAAIYVAVPAQAAPSLTRPLATSAARGHATDLPLAMLTSHEAPAATLGNECLSYASLCVSATDIINSIASVASAAAAWVAIILSSRGKEPGGSDKGDDEVEPSSEEAGEDFGDCLRAEGSGSGSKVIWTGCATSGYILSAETWIEVPTGDSYALASQYFYDKGSNVFMTVASVSSGANLLVEPSSYGGSDHYRTWWFTGDSMGPIQSPSPSPSANTTALVYGARGGWRLAA